MRILSWSRASINISLIPNFSFSTTCKPIRVPFFAVWLLLSGRFDLSRLIEWSRSRVFVGVYLKPNSGGTKSPLVLEFKNNCFVFWWNWACHSLIRPSLCRSSIQLPCRLIESRRFCAPPLRVLSMWLHLLELFNYV